MCLAIPAQITELVRDEQDLEPLAQVNILGVRRKVSLGLLLDDLPASGDWVLVHVGFALSKISAEQAAEQLALLRMLGEAEAAQGEIGPSDDACAEPGPRQAAGELP
jgi:hydrogenase expression/formation protein HypC